MFQTKNFTEKEVLEINPLVLAFIGDGVHTFFVRDYFVKNSPFNVKKQHIQSCKFCKASFQSSFLDRIVELLEEDEKQIVQRTRNTKTNNVAKNSSLEEYKKASSFEALIGYLYLLGRTERLNFFLNKSMEA